MHHQKHKNQGAARAKLEDRLPRDGRDGRKKRGREARAERYNVPLEYSESEDNTNEDLQAPHHFTPNEREGKQPRPSYYAPQPYVNHPPPPLGSQPGSAHSYGFHHGTHHAAYKVAETPPHMVALRRQVAGTRAALHGTDDASRRMLTLNGETEEDLRRAERKIQERERALGGW
jgi:hypothetical protein